MNKVSWFVKVSAVAALAAVVALFSVAGSSASNASAATPAATAKAEELKVDTLCKAPPTPTPVPTTPAPAETKAAAPATTVATAVATKAAVAPTAAATKAAPTEKPPTPTKTPVPPTATPIPKGKQPAWMGVTVNLNKKLLRGGQACVNVLAVNAGGPAAVAGLKAGDLILGIDKVVVKGLPDVYNAIDEKKSADVVEVTYQRDGKAAKAKVTLGLNPNSVDAPAAATPAATSAK